MIFCCRGSQENYFGLVGRQNNNNKPMFQVDTLFLKHWLSKWRNLSVWKWPHLFIMWFNYVKCTNFWFLCILLQPKMKSLYVKSILLLWFTKNCSHPYNKILNCLLIKVLNSLDYSGPYGRLLEHPETEGFEELFLPENDFKTCSAVNFPKKYQIETNQRQEI